MRYTITRFNKDFPNDDACLKFLFESKQLKACPRCGTEPRFYKLTGRKCYSCMHCALHIYPTAGTIFHKSETPLRSWFFAIFLFGNSKNGVSAKELERHLGVTYKTAWRIARQIRSLMAESGNPLGGIVEVDETYIGGKSNSTGRFKDKTAVIGAVEKQKNSSRVKAITSQKVNAAVALPFIRASVEAGTSIQTDESRIYSRLHQEYAHSSVIHSKGVYVDGDTHTNTIEGFWSQMKRSIDGTYHCVSPKHLQLYVDEFVYRYNLRNAPVFPALIAQAAKPALITGGSYV